MPLALARSLRSSHRRALLGGTALIGMAASLMGLSGVARAQTGVANNNIRVDGQTVIERWDIHGPTTDSTEWSVDSPRDVTVELAYFQNSGAARLSVRLERVETP